MVKITSQGGRFFGICWVNSNTTPVHIAGWGDSCRFVEWGRCGLYNQWLKRLPVRLDAVDELSQDTHNRIVQFLNKAPNNIYLVIHSFKRRGK